MGILGALLGRFGFSWHGQSYISRGECPLDSLIGRWHSYIHLLRRDRETGDICR
jgi:hypothetical protein